LSFFGKEKKKPSGKFKPKLIGSIIGMAFFGSLAVYAGVNMINGTGTVEGVAYEIKGDFYLLVFALGFGAGFAYWGFANMMERKKVRADRQKKKEQKSGGKHKKGENKK